jgi:hypothetical protein
MPTAGDATLFKPGQDERDIDVGYVGGYWPYKAQHIDKYLMTLIRQARQAGLRSAVYGWGGWPAEAQAGQLADEGVPRFFQRCRVCPCICEPHTAQWGIDVPERVFKVILSGAIAIHDPLSGLRRFSQHVLIAHDAPDFVRLCCDWAQPDMAAQRAELSVKQRSDVLREHTYFHRLAGLLGCVGFSAEADSMLEQAARLR